MRDRLLTWHEDGARKKIPSDLTVGSLWYHPKTKKLYQIVGYAFDSERERWMVKYRLQDNLDPIENVEDFDFAHLPEDFLREGRFLPVVR